MSLTVQDGGLLSLLVDTGRPSSRSLGVPVGGAADRAALLLGNAILGNEPNAPALEVTLRGPTLLAHDDTACVLFGAPFEMSIAHREPITARMSFTLHAGEILRIGGTPTGVRGYLCVKGGFLAREILGSRSAWSAIQPGDVLECESGTTTGRGLGFHTSDPTRTMKAVRLRVLPGPQRDWFPDEAFVSQSFTVSPDSNRMGIRLKGVPLSKRPGEMRSEPVAPGAVQVANDGLPIVLGVDGQTIGGYPKVAHVIRADLDRLAQLRPGTEIRFEWVTLAEADRLANERNTQLRDWQRRLTITTNDQ